MDPPRDSPPMIAPGRTSSSYGEERRSASAFGTTLEESAPESRELPPIWEHIARPETREEYFDGELRPKVPAKPPHATQHFRLAYVLNAHVAEGYMGAVEMLTRTDHNSDFAPDASIFPIEAGEEVGDERRLEELAFEVCSEQSLKVPEEKAKKLVKRGVRRVFCIVVGGPGRKRRKRLGQSYLVEWSPRTKSWSPLAEDSFIEDPCLATPLPVKALLDATRSDDAVVRALAARGNRAIREIRDEGKAEGKAEGLAEGEARGRAEALLSILEARNLDLTDETRRRILGCRDLTRLARWTRLALTVDSADDLRND